MTNIGWVGVFSDKPRISKIILIHTMDPWLAIPCLVGHRGCWVFHFFLGPKLRGDRVVRVLWTASKHQQQQERPTLAGGQGSWASVPDHRCCARTRRTGIGPMLPQCFDPSVITWSMNTSTIMEYSQMVHTSLASCSMCPPTQVWIFIGYATFETRFYEPEKLVPQRMILFLSSSGLCRVQLITVR